MNIRDFDLVRDEEEVTNAFRAAVRHELRIHKCLGNPIAVWKNGKVVIIPPEEIQIPPDPYEYRDQSNLNAW